MYLVIHCENKLLVSHSHCFITTLGGPQRLDSNQLAASMASAKFLIHQEQQRHPDVNAGSPVGGLSDAGLVSTTIHDDLMDVWRLLPNIRDLPEAMLRKLSPEAILQLNMALGKDQKNTAKLTVNARLSLNAKKLAANPLKVEAATDNRKDILHPARFLGGATCPNVDLWLTGRRYLGDRGVAALGGYDLDSVGCGGCVTPKGWEALHNPSSQELKIKLFYLPNVTNSGLSAKRVALEDGGEALSIGDSLRDIADLEGYKAALNTAREAMHSVMPWNRSISAIVGFMTNTNYLQDDLKNSQRRAAILSEFTDYILGRNALNWENGHPFLTTDELAHVWAQWKGKRSALFASRYTEKPDTKRSSDKRTNICKRYNAGICPNQKDKECKSFLGTVLRHVCNKFVGTNKHCEKDHPRTEHK